MKTFTLIISISLLVMNGCQNAMVQQKKLNYLALGDSYTIGESVDEDQRWPVQLVQTLNSEEVKFDSAKIIATTGWTTDELLKAIGSEELTETYDLVSLLIGVNNQYRGYPIDQFEKEFEELLQIAILRAGGAYERVFVVSIPDWGVTQFAIKRGVDSTKVGSEIDQYNTICNRIAANNNVKYFNITDISRIAKEDQTLLAPDGLHPSGKMYEQWVQRIAPWILENF
ncbi:MAG: SGNH/GDSL hydrolase family protein [Cyclobacteriaceae bacterium]